jgi:cytochrome c biogenesis protein CcmG, thiol:disulfide interchange protein DsbE
LLLVKRPLLPILISLVGVALLGLLVYGVTHQAASRTLDDAVFHHERPTAPDATRSLPLLAAPGKGSLSAYAGRVVVLNFWASWCIPCQAEAPLLESAQRELASHRGTVLGVTYLDASTDSQSFVVHNHISYPNLRDTDGEFAHSYGTDQLPETFLIDRHGKIAAISRGEIDKAFLDRAVALAESS